MLSSNMNEIAKAGANHPKNEEENKCQKEEVTNTFQADLLLRIGSAVQYTTNKKGSTKSSRCSKKGETGNLRRGIDSRSCAIYNK